MQSRLPDGFYAVVHDGRVPFVAAFVVENGQVTMCAPILRKRFAYWERRARIIDVPH